MHQPDASILITHLTGGAAVVMVQIAPGAGARRVFRRFQLPQVRAASPHLLWRQW